MKQNSVIVFLFLTVFLAVGAIVAAVSLPYPYIIGGVLALGAGTCACATSHSAVKSTQGRNDAVQQLSEQVRLLKDASANLQPQALESYIQALQANEYQFLRDLETKFTAFSENTQTAVTSACTVMAENLQKQNEQAQKNLSDALATMQKQEQDFASTVINASQDAFNTQIQVLTDSQNFLKKVTENNQQNAEERLTAMEKHLTAAIDRFEDASKEHLANLSAENKQSLADTMTQIRQTVDGMADAMAKTFAETCTDSVARFETVAKETAEEMHKNNEAVAKSIAENNAQSLRTLQGQTNTALAEQKKVLLQMEDCYRNYQTQTQNTVSQMSAFTAENQKSLTNTVAQIQKMMTDVSTGFAGNIASFGKAIEDMKVKNASIVQSVQQTNTTALNTLREQLDKFIQEIKDTSNETYKAFSASIEDFNEAIKTMKKNSEEATENIQNANTAVTSSVEKKLDKALDELKKQTDEALKKQQDVLAKMQDCYNQYKTQTQSTVESMKKQATEDNEFIKTLLKK